MKNEVVETGAVAQQETKRMPAPVRLEGLAHELEISSMENFLDEMAQVDPGRLSGAEVASINMVTRYLKFAEQKGRAVRRFFIGWTARAKVDFKTKMPIMDENGQQIYQPCAIFWTGKNEDSMEMNQATELVKTLQEMRVKRWDMLQMTFEELVTISNGHNQQKFSVVLLK